VFGIHYVPHRFPRWLKKGRGINPSPERLPLSSDGQQKNKQIGLAQQMFFTYINANCAHISFKERHVPGN
jgi:hypothetical protein